MATYVEGVAVGGVACPMCPALRPNVDNSPSWQPHEVSKSGAGFCQSCMNSISRLTKSVEISAAQQQLYVNMVAEADNRRNVVKAARRKERDAIARQREEIAAASRTIAVLGTNPEFLQRMRQQALTGGGQSTGQFVQAADQTLALLMDQEYQDGQEDDAFQGYLPERQQAEAWKRTMVFEQSAAAASGEVVMEAEYTSELAHAGEVQQDPTQQLYRPVTYPSGEIPAIECQQHNVLPLTYVPPGAATPAVAPQPPTIADITDETLVASSLGFTQFVRQSVSLGAEEVQQFWAMFPNLANMVTPLGKIDNIYTTCALFTGLSMLVTGYPPTTKFEEDAKEYATPFAQHALGDQDSMPEGGYLFVPYPTPSGNYNAVVYHDGRVATFPVGAQIPPLGPGVPQLELVDNFLVLLGEQS